MEPVARAGRRLRRHRGAWDSIKRNWQSRRGFLYHVISALSMATSRSTWSGWWTSPPPSRCLDDYLVVAPMTRATHARTEAPTAPRKAAPVG